MKLRKYQIEENVMNTIKWKMPDQYLTEWYRNLSGAVKTAFYAAFVAGLAAHLYQFTNKLL